MAEGLTVDSFLCVKHPTRTSATIGLPIVAGLGLIALTGCGALGSITNGGANVPYESKTEAVQQGSTMIPTWMPDDATGIKIVEPAGKKGLVMTFTSASGVPLAGDCSASSAGALEPGVPVDWWPKTPPSQNRMACGLTELASTGDTWYAWAAERS